MRGVDSCNDPKCAKSFPLEENLRYLTDLVGERLTGTPAADHAVSWAVKAFRYAGVDEVHTEKFTIPAGWHEDSTQAEMVFPAEYPLHLISTGWSPPTQADGITADVVDVGFGDDAGFTKVGVSAKGAIVLVHSGVLLLPQTYPMRPWRPLESRVAP